MKTKHLTLTFFALIALTVALFTVDLATGSVYVPIGDVVNALLGETVSSRGLEDIVLIFRLPKALTALAGGAALSTSGLMLQTLFRNPLAGPSILGITSGASLGVALVILGAGCGLSGAGFLGDLGLGGNLLLIASSALGAAVVMFMVLILASRVRNIMTVLIVGILGSFAISSVVSVLVHFSRPEMVQAYLAWTFGSFASVTWDQLKVFFPLTLTLVATSTLMGKPLNVLLLGEDYSRSMGLDPWKIQMLVLGITAILVGCVTAFCGPIGFIGIAVPHLARALLGTSDHRILLAANALLGSSTALLADLVAQLPGYRAILPMNAVTALLGSPVIIWFILKRSRKGSGPFV